MTKTSRTLLATLLLGTMLGGVAVATEPDPHGLAKAIAERLAAKRRTAAVLDATDFQGTDLGCIILPRRELRPFGYAGHGFFCEAAVSGEILGGTLNRSGRQLCEIRGTYSGDFCYDFDICGVAERLCVV
jgi:hypothetical protein